jgi:hypothetical protein
MRRPDYAEGGAGGIDQPETVGWNASAEDAFGQTFVPEQFFPVVPAFGQIFGPEQFFPVVAAFGQIFGPEQFFPVVAAFFFVAASKAGTESRISR